MNHVDLSALFRGMQGQMQSQLSTNREFIHHPGSKGDALENAWIEWLQNYLPNRYSVDKAIVIDCHGNTSDQIDIHHLFLIKMALNTFQPKEFMLFLKSNLIFREM